MSMVGRRYLDRGPYKWDRLHGAAPWPEPRPCVVLVVGRASTRGAKAGPRTALVEYDDGARAVVPVNRRLRRAE